MTERDIIDLVVLMREEQRAYFKSRAPSRLQAAKDYERRVDQALRDRAQGKLIDDEYGDQR